MENQAKELLQKVELWDNYGKYYHRFTNTSTDCALQPPPLNVEDELFGFMQLPRADKNDGIGGIYRHSHHSTDSQSKLDEFYTPELKSEVEEQLYPMDVQLWRLVEAEEGLISGSELATKISGQCKTTAYQLLARPG